MSDPSMYKTTTSYGDDSMAIGATMVMMMLYFAVIVLLLTSMWKLFTKAGRPGWHALIPIYNSMVLAEIVGRPGWVGLLNFVPLLNIYVNVVLALDISKSFGKDVVFGVLAIFFPYVTFPILGFGSARYVGPAAQGKVLEP